jgi:hypothetical protein
MKNKWKVIGGVITGMVMTTAVQAIPIALNTVYTSTLASTTPADDITVKWEVSTTAVPGTTLGAGDYDYEYQVVNAETATTVDNFAVSFNAIPGVNVLTTGGGPAGTISAAELGIGVNWFSLSALAAKGGSTAGLNTTGVLYFTSPDLPTLGNADANDHNPPSPWASDPNGMQVGIPNVPDGGLTASMLGMGLLGLGYVRRMIK